MGWSKNFGNPEGVFGKLLLYIMNRGHGPLSRWGLTHVAWQPQMSALDVGCGGGMNVKRLLELCPQGKVSGIDISVASVKKTSRLNADQIDRRCDIQLASVEDIPYPDNSFDVVTAVETHYFWPDLDVCLREIKRVLRPGGTLMIAAELSDPECFWGRVVEGLRICSADRLAEVLVQAGLEEIKVDTAHGQWVCVTGKKP